MRINLEQGINSCQLVYDTYDNDLKSLKSILEFTARQTVASKKTLVLTDFHASNIDPDTLLYNETAQFLHNQHIDKLIGIGPQLLAHAAAFKLPEIHFYNDIQSLLTSRLLDNLEKNLIIVKGSDTCNTEKLINKLKQKCNNSVLEVDLDAIEQNVNFFRTQLAPGTQLIAMVKASAYGSGSFEVASFLQQCQVDYLAVAYADEGVILRKNGVRLPIMVMNPSPAGFDKLLTYQLEPVIYSLGILKYWKDFLGENPIPTGLHIKIDTGMHRLGFMEKDIEGLIEILKSMPYIAIKSIFSHLAAPGNRRHDAYTHAQAKLFQRLVKSIEKKLGLSLRKHLLNTAGALYFPAYQLDMVRLGIGLYGLSKKAQPHLKIAHTLKTIISQIKEIPAGATIGYERRGVAHQEPTKIAVLAIGYADGFRRSLSNGQGKVWINGKLAPVIGNVCMDMTMIDMTGIEAQEGDEVIIFGEVLPVAEIASDIGTIVYEVLTNINERIKRVYYKKCSFKDVSFSIPSSTKA